jgi:phosphohistidine swiveling domain-containing protein
MGKLIVSLAEIGASDLSLAGGKGSQLGVMLAAGLPVPDGFCVTTEAFRQGMDDSVRHAIVAAYERMGRGAVAVRSSATAEDLPEASFAGQQDTFLNVVGEAAVVAAVEACWRSLFTDRAVAYRRDRGIPDDAVAMAVVVQRMVNADAAGVLFTINPVTGAIDELIIEAARGLGDKVVSAQVTPDRYRLRRRAPHRIIQQEGEDTSGLLTPAVLGELARLGLAAERLLGHAADIEWAVAAGHAYLLQARAVTAAGPRRPVVRFGSRWNAEHCQGRLIFWSNYNIRDTMPYPHTPFSWSFWNYLVLPSSLAALGIQAPEDREKPDDVPCVVDLVDGRMYWNINVLAGMTGSRPHWLVVRMAALLDAEYGLIVKEILSPGEFVPVARPFSLRRAWHSLRHAPAGVGTLLGKITAEQAWHQLESAKEEVASYSDIDLRLLSEEQLIATARYLAAENLPRSGIALVSAGPALPASVLLSWMLRRCGQGELFPRLMSAVGGNPTLETALAMWDLAEQAGGEVRAVFARAETTQVPEALKAFESGRTFLAAVDAFLQTHGHRAVREFDFSCPRWREDPTFVYEMLRNYLAHPADRPTPRQHYQRQVEQHEEAKRALERATRYHPIRRWLCRKLVRVIEKRMPLREAFKFYMLIGLAYVRDLLMEVGRRQVERGVLDKPDDFLFLSIPEAEKISMGQLDQAWVREQIALRRREFAANMRSDPPLVVRSDGKPVMKPAAAGEVLRGAGASPGIVRGPARVLFDPADGASLHPGEILVAKFTDPGWTPLFLTAGGLVMEVGGIASHGAIVAREYGLPAAVGVKNATRILRDGEIIEVNGGTGEVRRLKTAEADIVATA